MAEIIKRKISPQLECERAIACFIHLSRQFIEAYRNANRVGGRQFCLCEFKSSIRPAKTKYIRPGIDNSWDLSFVATNMLKDLQHFNLQATVKANSKHKKINEIQFSQIKLNSQVKQFSSAKVLDSNENQV